MVSSDLKFGVDLLEFIGCQAVVVVSFMTVLVGANLFDIRVAEVAFDTVGRQEQCSETTSYHIIISYSL